MIACSVCGAQPDPPADDVPLGWMVERERGRTSYVCTSCARRHVRAIEGKLDQEYW
jgi:hypothetical protein